MERTCLNCSNPIVQRENENNYRYQRRKYCSQKCTHLYFRKNRVGWYGYFPNPAPEPLSETITTTITTIIVNENSNSETA